MTNKSILINKYLSANTLNSPIKRKRWPNAEKKKKEEQNFAVHKRLTSCIRQHIASLVAHSKEFVCKLGDLGLIPGLGTSPGAWQPTPVFLPGESAWTEEPGGL